MRIELEMPETLTITLPRKAGGGTADVRMAKIYASPAAMAGLLIFAMKQKCGDAVAPETVQGEEAKRRVAAKVALFEAGDAADSGVREGDPVEREAWAIARSRVLAAIKASGYKIKTVPSEKIDDACRKLLEGGAGKAIYETAKENVARRAGIEAEVDLSALGL